MALIAAATFAVAGCNSDEVPRSASDDTTETSTTGETMETGEDSTDTGPPPDKTCRDGISCLIACAAGYPANPTPEDPNLEDFFLGCFLECGKGLTAEEALAMIELVSCVSEFCYANESCVANSEPGADDDAACQLCLAGGLLDENWEPCLEEAQACR